MTPTVSVITPVYNSVDYLRETIRSVVDQTIGHDRLELVAVDDGSTDGSDQVLAEFAADHPWVTVITQENSGTAGGARNPGIERARGDFVFFLDSDDTLAPDALRRMVEEAETEESDVVLGKVAGLGGRRPPLSMFRKSVHDADVLGDHVFNTLAPWKLIRRSLIEDLDLRFPVDQKVGEDQPFMAAVYLSARKISILADTDYYFLRRRDDGSNLTRSGTSSADQLETALRLAKTIETYTEPGALRDGLLKRPFGWTMRRCLDGRWLTVPRSEQAAMAERFRTEAGHLCTDGVRRSLNVDARIELGLLLAGELDALATYIERVRPTTDRHTVWDGGAFRLQLPDELARVVPKEDLVVDAPEMTCRLEGLAIEGSGAFVRATVKAKDFAGVPDEVLLRVRKRGSSKTRDFEMTTQEWAADTAVGALAGTVRDLEPGIWDVYVVVRFGSDDSQVRLGANRARTIEPEGLSNLDETPSATEAVIAYFTKGPGNLSLDIGGGLHKNAAYAHVVGLTLDENERCLLLVSTTRAPQLGDEYFAEVKGVPRSGGRLLLPQIRLGERLVGVRLPVDKDMMGARLRITAVLGGARAPLPVTGTEFWPARAAGYALVGTEDGGVRVDRKGAGGSGQAMSYDAGTQNTRRLLRRSPVEATRSVARTRIAPAVKRIPVLGTAATKAVRAVRGRRA